MVIEETVMENIFDSYPFMAFANDLVDDDELPKENHSYLILGYDTEYIANQQKNQLLNWAKALDKKTDLRVIYNILCHCSNN